MARVRMDEILDYLAFPLQKALAEGLTRVGKATDMDIDRLFREFRTAARLKCGRWDYVPDEYVQVECDEVKK